MTKKTIKEQITERAERAIKNLLKPEEIERRVTHFIEQHIEKTIGNALGLKNDSWCGWMLNSGSEHPIRNLIAAKADALVVDLLSPAIENFKLKLKRADLVNARKQMQEAYNRAIVDALFERARETGIEQAKLDAVAILDKLLSKELTDDAKP